MKKIFELFYRPENELTRETVGTGIGLALVRQLAAAMGGARRRAQLRAGRGVPPRVPASKRWLRAVGVHWLLAHGRRGGAA